MGNNKNTILRGLAECRNLEEALSYGDAARQILPEIIAEEPSLMTREMLIWGGDLLREAYQMALELREESLWMCREAGLVLIGALVLNQAPSVL